MMNLSKGQPLYGYGLERIWLNFFGANFEMPCSRPGDRSFGRAWMIENRLDIVLKYLYFKSLVSGIDRNWI